MNKQMTMQEAKQYANIFSALSNKEVAFQYFFFYDAKETAEAHNKELLTFLHNKITGEAIRRGIWQALYAQVKKGKVS